MNVSNARLVQRESDGRVAEERVTSQPTGHLLGQRFKVAVALAAKPRRRGEVAARSGGLNAWSTSSTIA